MAETFDEALCDAVYEIMYLNDWDKLTTRIVLTMLVKHSSLPRKTLTVRKEVFVPVTILDLVKNNKL